jgi:putative endonuclease
MQSSTGVNSEAVKPWFIYILRCADNSLYTGITLDVGKRLNQHNGLDKNGAKYTKARRPVQLVYQEMSHSRSDASKREHAIKSLKKSEKESLIRAIK